MTIQLEIEKSLDNKEFPGKNKMAFSYSECFPSEKKTFLYKIWMTELLSFGKIGNHYGFFFEFDSKEDIDKMIKDLQNLREEKYFD